jgi:hypothetical protein
MKGASLSPSPRYTGERAGERGSREAQSRELIIARGFGPALLPDGNNILD